MSTEAFPLTDNQERMVAVDKARRSGELSNVDQLAPDYLSLIMSTEAELSVHRGPPCALPCRLLV